MSFIKVENPTSIQNKSIDSKDQSSSEDQAIKDSSIDEISSVTNEAYVAWNNYKNTSGKVRAAFLRAIANNIERLGEQLIQVTSEESGLPEARIRGERGRTCNQIRQFADLVEEGRWVNATIELGEPSRSPIPKPDLRKMESSIGPIAVFTASNFPLAFSTAGGDTVSALAAGCPVIIKAHPAHPRTNQLVSGAIHKAVLECQLPKGTFATVYGPINVGKQLVLDPLIKGIAFTGSFQGGKSIYDLAHTRVVPIPVYAEMGSINPVFILPHKMDKEYQQLATQMACSINLGAGQFCTNPGVIVVEKSSSARKFITAMENHMKLMGSSTMLTERICSSFTNKRMECISRDGVESFNEANAIKSDNPRMAYPSFASISAKKFIHNRSFHEEIFGPFSLIVLCKDKVEMHTVAESIEGQLTSSIMADESEISNYSNMVDTLSQKSGRIIYNGVPTGVEVSRAMHHGGPFPATTGSKYTSVGTDAIYRFTRPICYQNTPNIILPEELQDQNPLSIWRNVNGERTKS